MTNYSERSLRLAAELREQALRNLGRAPRSEPKSGRPKDEAPTRKKR